MNLFFCTRGRPRACFGPKMHGNTRKYKGFCQFWWSQQTGQLAGWPASASGPFFDPECKETAGIPMVFIILGLFLGPLLYEPFYCARRILEQTLDSGQPADLPKILQNWPEPFFGTYKKTDSYKKNRSSICTIFTDFGLPRAPRGPPGLISD